MLDGLELDQVVLVAHDAGGPEAIDFTVTHPQRVASLVLLNTYYGRSDHLRLPEMIALMADPGLVPLTDALLDDTNQRLWLLLYTGRRFGQDDSVPPDGIAAVSILRQFFGDTTQTDALIEIRAWTADIPHALDRQDAMIASSQLRATRASVSVIFGREDPNLNPDLAQHIGRLFENSQLHLLAGTIPLAAVGSSRRGRRSDQTINRRNKNNFRLITATGACRWSCRPHRARRCK